MLRLKPESTEHDKLKLVEEVMVEVIRGIKAKDKEKVRQMEFLMIESLHMPNLSLQLMDFWD